jgi:hypothetical protein
MKRTIIHISGNNPGILLTQQRREIELAVLLFKSFTNSSMQYFRDLLCQITSKLSLISHLHQVKSFIDCNCIYTRMTSLPAFISTFGIANNGVRKNGTVVKDREI